MQYACPAPSTEKATMQNMAVLCDGDPMIVLVAGRWCCLLCRRQCTTLQELHEHLSNEMHVEKEAAGRRNGRIVDKPRANSWVLNFAQRALLHAAQLQRKLLTRHDPLHVHKLLGSACALNFAAKGWALLWTAEVCPFDAALAAHAALTASSFLFQLPRSPLALTHGYLNQEIRLHTACFSARALVLISVDALRRWMGMPALDAKSAALCCLPFHLAVDEITRALGAPQVSSIRGHHEVEECRTNVWWFRLTRSSSLRDNVRPLLSGAQFVNNYCLLFGGSRRQGIAFAWLAWSQLNAFLMTLRKKQLISEDGLALSYTTLSAIVTFACLSQAGSPLTSLLVGSALMTLRCMGCNKYLLWLALLAAGGINSVERLKSHVESYTYGTMQE